MDNRYLAIWQVDGKDVLVLPRSRKRNTFDSIAAAECALEQRARRFPRDTRGLVKAGHEIVLTVAL